MDFSDVLLFLESNFNRDCIIFKDSGNMQKTVNYSMGSTFSININGSAFDNIESIILLLKNNAIYIYLYRLIGANKEFKIADISTISRSS